jgi:hypothetical protein
MLESVHKILPISGAERDLVASCHAALGCTGDKLKKKFNKLCRVMISTGNPNIPDTVCEAKKIRELFGEKTEDTTGSTEEIFSPGDVEEAEDLFIEKMEILLLISFLGCL